MSKRRRKLHYVTASYLQKQGFCRSSRDAFRHVFLQDRVALTRENILRWLDPRNGVSQEIAIGWLGVYISTRYTQRCYEAFRARAERFRQLGITREQDNRENLFNSIRSFLMKNDNIVSITSTFTAACTKRWVAKCLRMIDKEMMDELDYLRRQDTAELVRDLVQMISGFRESTRRK